MTRILLLAFLLSACRSPIGPAPTQHLKPEVMTSNSKREPCHIGRELLEDEGFSCQKD